MAAINRIKRLSCVIDLTLPADRRSGPNYSHRTPPSIGLHLSGHPNSCQKSTSPMSRMIVAKRGSRRIASDSGICSATMILTG
jgi:hypothetical protein